MRVIFVNRFFHPDHSATSQIASDLAFELAARGMEVVVDHEPAALRRCGGGAAAGGGGARCAHPARAHADVRARQSCWPGAGLSRLLSRLDVARAARGAARRRRGGDDGSAAAGRGALAGRGAARRAARALAAGPVSGGRGAPGGPRDPAGCGRAARAAQRGAAARPRDRGHRRGDGAPGRARVRAGADASFRTGHSRRTWTGDIGGAAGSPAAARMGPGRCIHRRLLGQHGAGAPALRA